MSARHQRRKPLSLNVLIYAPDLAADLLHRLTRQVVAAEPAAGSAAGSR